MAEHCKSCEAPIDWAITDKGRRIPLDRTTSSAVANIVLDPDGTARVVAAGTGTRISHFATCPNAGQHRRNRRGA
jgi:hypothetical protein